MRVSRVLVLCRTAFAAGCDGGGEAPTSPAERQPSTLSALGATAFAGVVGAAVQDSLRVRVLDQHGAGLAGVESSSACSPAAGLWQPPARR
jgi:hypothetical protein